MSMLLRRARGVVAAVAPPTPPTPAIALSGDLNVTLVQGGFVDVPLTLDRTNFPDPVALVASSLPTGVTASYPDGETYTDEIVTRPVRFTAAIDAPPVSADAIAVTGSGTGVSDSVLNGLLTVQSAGAASIALSGDTAVSVAQGASFDVLLSLTRTNYLDDVTVVESSLPAGLSVSYPSTAVYSDGTLTRTARFTATSGATPTTDNIVFTASGAGVADATLTIAVTITEFTPDTGFLTERPAGYTTLADETFSTVDFDNSEVGSITDYTYGDIVVKKYAPDKAQVMAGEGAGGVDALRVKHLSGQTTYFGAKINVVSMPTDVRKVYTSAIIKVAAPYQWDQTAHKMFYPFIRVNSAVNDGKPAFIFKRFADDGTYRFFPQIQQVYIWTGTKFQNTNLPMNINSITMLPDVHYRVSVQMEMHTIGLGDEAHDGIVRLWVATYDDVTDTWGEPLLITEYTNLKFGNAATPTTNARFTNLQWDLYRGGGNTPILTEDANMYFSRIHWSTAP